MQRYLEGDNNVVYRDLTETLSAEIKKAMGNNFKAVVCSGKQSRP